MLKALALIAIFFLGAACFANIAERDYLDASTAVVLALVMDGLLNLTGE